MGDFTISGGLKEPVKQKDIAYHEIGSTNSSIQNILVISLCKPSCVTSPFCYYMNRA